MPADPESPLAPVELGSLPRRRPASTDPGVFASRLRSAPPAGADPDVSTVAGAVSRAPGSDEEYRAQIGRRARLVRVGRDLSQDEVAAVTGVTRNFVSAVERGAQGLDAWRLRQLAGALGVSSAGCSASPTTPTANPLPGRG